MSEALGNKNQGKAFGKNGTKGGGNKGRKSFGGIGLEPPAEGKKGG